MSGVLLVGGLTLLASFFCSLFEAALYAISPAQIEVLRARGVGGAARLERLRANVDEPIAAILTVNTIAHTIGSAWCGAMVGTAYGSWSVGVFAAVFTVLVLALTEIVPKSIGVRYAGTLGPHFAWPIQVMIWSVWPIVHVARLAMRAITGGGESDGPTEEEVLRFSALAARHGNVRDDEYQWVKNALRLDRITASDLRTPRTVVSLLDADTQVGDLTATTAEWVHSRVPVFENGDRDRIIGLVYRREVFDAAVKGELDRSLRDLMHDLRFVPESMPGHELLTYFIGERRHMVAIVNEYGGFQGVVTLEDVLEYLLGEEIVDEHDEHEDMQQAARAKGGVEPAETDDAGDGSSVKSEEED